MKYLFTPTVFHSVAQLMSGYRWRLLIWSALGLTLYFLLTTQINFNTPNALIWLTMFIVFAALQALVLSAFIFFFQNLPSKKAKETFWYQLYNLVEWSEAILFTILLPLPSLIFLFALVRGVLVS